MEQRGVGQRRFDQPTGYNMTINQEALDEVRTAVAAVGTLSIRTSILNSSEFSKM